MRNVTKVTDKQDLLDFIVNKVNVYRYSAKEVDDVVGAPDKFPYQEYYGLLADDFTTHNSSTNCGGSEVAYNIIKNTITDDTNGDGEQNKNDGHNKHTYNLPALVTTLIGAFQQHVKNGGENGGENGGGDHSKCAEKAWVEEWCSNLELADKEMDKRLDALEAGNGSNIDLSDYATKTYVNDAIDDIELTPGPKGDKGDDGVSVTNVSINSSNHLITTLSDNRTIDAGALPSGSGSDFNGAIEYFSTGYGYLEQYPYLKVNTPMVLEDNIEIKGNFIVTGENSLSGGTFGAPHFYTDQLNVKKIGKLGEQDYVEFDCDVKFNGNVIGSNGSGSSDTITIKKIQGQNPAYGERMKYVEFEDAICVKQIFGPEGNVSWLGDLSIEGNIFASGNIHMGEDLYIDGAIVFPDGSKLTSAGTVATVNEDLLEEQQNTIQQQQETIANLEARIARLEEMLGINN